MLKLSYISIYIGYTVSVILCVFGIVLLTGFAPLYVPAHLRFMFGVVMILWGIYRFVLTRTRVRQMQKDPEE